MHYDIMRFFAYDRVPVGVAQNTSRWFHDLAHLLAADLPTCEETAVSLRKLLEAKDAAVRATLLQVEG